MAGTPAWCAIRAGLRRARSVKLACDPGRLFPYLLVPVRPVVVVELRPAAMQASSCVRNMLAA